MGEMDGVVLALYHARDPRLAGTAWDWRYSRWADPLSEDTLRHSFDLFRDLLGLPSRDAVLPRAELLLRAAAAWWDFDYSGCLTNAWTAIETMLGDLFERYLDEIKDRPTGTNMKFLNRKRREFFKSKDVTAACSWSSCL
jgi:hypothetical protein